MRRIGAIGLVALLTATSAWAGLPPSPTATVYTYGSPAMTVGGVGSSSASLDGVTATVQLSPTPTVGVSGVVAAHAEVYFLASLSTYLKFTGAAIGSQVSIDVDATPSVTDPGVIPCPIYCVYTPYAADIDVGLGWGYLAAPALSASGNIGEFGCGYGYGGSGCPVGQQMKTFDVTVEPATYVYIDAGGVGGWSGGATTIDASLDPFIQIDPTWAQTHPGVSLQLQWVGIGGAPEPSAWVLMMLALGAAGAVLRGRRRAALA